jgi:hypothetical protein
MRTRLRRLFTLPFLLLALGMTFVLTSAPAAAAAGVASGAGASATPDFRVVIEADPGTNPPSRTVKRGSGAPYFVDIFSVNGFNGHVTLSLSGNIPANGVVSIGDPTGFGPLNDGDVAIQIQKRTTITGTFAMTIHATSGGLEHDVAIRLTVR